MAPITLGSRKCQVWRANQVRKRRAKLSNLGAGVLPRWQAGEIRLQLEKPDGLAPDVAVLNSYGRGASGFYEPG